MVVLGSVTLALHLGSLFRESRLAGNLVSEGLWKRLVVALGGTVHGRGEGATASYDTIPLLIAVATFALAAWMAGALGISRFRRISMRQALAQWGFWGWSWWLLPLVWEFLDLAAGLMNLMSAASVLRGTIPLWQGAIWAGWLTTGFTISRPISGAPIPADSRRKVPSLVWMAAGLYALIFTAMNFGLYESLMLPHGDSAMYEEHLWNLLHGKGFRSYLDGGRLFLGEHVQVIHLLLIPLYLLWPSQLLLELVQSAALAAGAIPVYSLARRHTGSSSAGTLFAIAYLLYVPMQCLDIAVDFKTFRPNSFEIPLFLAAFDALERRRWPMFGLMLGLALLCQEDAATILAPLGVWIACRAGALTRPIGSDLTGGSIEDPARDGVLVRRIRFAGMGLAVFGVLYVLVVVKVVLPWFRGGADVHFAQYFTELGDSSNSITAAVFRHPELVLRRILDPKSLSFGMALIVPLGFLPLLSPGRLLIAAPLFGVLCLSHITNSPQHHFHAPLIPVIFWAAAAGLESVPRLRELVWRYGSRFRRPSKPPDERRGIPPESIAFTGRMIPNLTSPSVAPLHEPRSAREVATIERAALWAMFCSACMGFFLGLSPLALGFWDPDSYAWWRRMYVPGERSQQVPALLALLPATSRVASTDFIHPRLTHYERSYDYSKYRPIVPDDTDYIVIDRRHHYSEIHEPRQIKELQEHPEEWELLPDETNGCFFVLKRRR